MDWGSSDESESSSSSDDEKYGGNLANKFLKNRAGGEKDEQKEQRRREKKREQKDKRREDDEEGWEEVKGGVPLIMFDPTVLSQRNKAKSGDATTEKQDTETGKRRLRPSRPPKRNQRRCRRRTRPAATSRPWCRRRAEAGSAAASQEQPGADGAAVQVIYAKDSTDRIRTQAILCHIYHHALHDNWYQARDLMLMSHLQESIQHADVPTRSCTTERWFSWVFAHSVTATFVTLTMPAGHPEWWPCKGNGLLPQRKEERTNEQEKIEKRRQMPFHKHINLELLEVST
ncbi:hypothetical protein HPB52_025149 [Rhipicephalus sanguineus]|uniref:Eukaryotic translation initiation factor 3 subunit C N-terminal domain-containing protein n=1 Tax=Rhipicephalus sanguineus TaxID=34632 RepID=A0A9D4TDD8_RHISA|nr:hypothetical protein HPB52_025149 [Rhipicephalus sanguineus]